MEDLTAEIPQHLELTRILENKDQDFNKSNPIVMDVNGLTGQLMSVCPAHANSTTYLSIHIPLLLFVFGKTNPYTSNTIYTNLMRKIRSKDIFRELTLKETSTTTTNFKRED